jgi:hypothetical protein
LSKDEDGASTISRTGPLFISSFDKLRMRIVADHPETTATGGPADLAPLTRAP